METDITCDSRPNPILNYVQSKTTGILYQVRTIDSTGEIMMCGNFETTKGLGAKLNKSGTLAWAYLFSIPCEVMMLDTKQEYVMMVLKYPGRGVEIHRYAVKDGSKSFIFEYGVDTIYTLQDGIFKNDYYWFVGYLNTGVCFVLKISSTRRYVYMCPANTKMWNMLIPDKDPVIVGNNNANIPFIIKIGENDFATSLSYKISNINSDYMALRSSGADDTNLLWSLSLTSDKSLYLTYFNLNTTSFTWTKKYNYQVVKPMIQYSVVFDEYILLVRDEVNNRICFFRLDYSDGSITFYKCNANGSLVKYNVYTVFGAVESPSLSSPPVNLEESWSLKKNYKKFIYKIITLNLLRTRSSYFLFFLFKYDVLIIKQPPIALLAKKF